MAGLCKAKFGRKSKRNMPCETYANRDALYGFHSGPKQELTTVNISKIEYDEYEDMTSPVKPKPRATSEHKQSNQEFEHRANSTDILNDTLNSSSVTTPANLPMMAVKDYQPTSSQLDGVSVRSGSIVSALYKTGRFLFVRTPDNSTGFLPISVVRPLCSMSDISSQTDKTLYENLPVRQPKNVTFVSPGGVSNSSSCAYTSPGDCHCHSCMDIRCRTPPTYGVQYHSTCSCCEDSPVNTLMMTKCQHRSSRINTTDSKKNGSFDDSSFDSCYSSSDVSSGNSHATLDEAFISKRCDCCTRKHATSDSIRSSKCCKTNATYTISDHERFRKRRYLSTQRGARLTIIFDFKGHYDGDISVRRQEVVTLLDDDGPDWLWVRRSDGKEGFIPRTYAVNLEILNMDPYSRTTYL